MCADCYDNPEEAVEGFPDHGNEDPENNVFVERNSDPRDFIVLDGGAE